MKKNVHKIVAINTATREKNTVCEVYAPGDAVNILHALKSTCNSKEIIYWIDNKIVNN